MDKVFMLDLEHWHAIEADSVCDWGVTLWAIENNALSTLLEWSRRSGRI